MSRESNRAKAPSFAAAMDELRESIPAESMKVRWVKEGDFEAGADPLDEPGTMWISGELFEAMSKLHAEQSAPKRGR